MRTDEIDAVIMACPYFGGKKTINRMIFKDGVTHIGTCDLEFHYEKICPSDRCVCAKKFGLKRSRFGQVGWNCEREDDYHEPIGEVLAWMPLPKPYEVKGSE